MEQKEMELIQKTIDYQFNNTDLLQQAFVRRSYSEEYGGENNEVLEFIGDKALDFVVMKTMMRRFGNITSGDFREFKTKYQEGKFTEIKKDLVERKMLARCIDKFGFNEYLILGKGDIKQNVQDKDSVKEDLFEAIVGAVAIDSDWNLDSIEEVVKMMLDFNDFFGNNRYDDEIDYVGEIQKWSQKQNDELPDYSFCETYDGYRCSLRLNGVYYSFYGDGKSKSGARYIAAQAAYGYLEENGMLFSLKDEIGEADFDRSINQLQELYQKGYINEPFYEFFEEKDYYGNSIWNCKCRINGIKGYYTGSSTNKKEAKKQCAYALLCDILR